jgi:lipopolysaccharide export system permease protein
MAYTPGGTDLYLTLRDGEVHEVKRDDPAHFNRTFYSTNRIKVAGVGNTLERTEHDSYRGDREMTICAMQEVVAQARQDIARVRREAEDAVITELRRLIKLAPLPRSAAAVDSAPPATTFYCRVVGTVKRWLLPKSAQAAQVVARAPGTPATPSVSSVAQATAPSVYEQRVRAARQRAAVYEVEIQKKLAISAACVTFALLGVPLAIRFPRGGVGLVIGTSLAVFSVYYVGLIGGEELGDRLILSPFLAMWLPNLIFTVVGLALLATMRRAGSTAHGGDWDDLKQALFGWVGKLRRTGNA